MSEIVISVENISKTYRLGQIGGGTLREDVARWMARLRGKPDPFVKIGEEHHARKMGEQFWALDKVSFQVKRGEVLGIIGSNGAGKSTLLKILSQVTCPTSGQIKIKGRIASLLEVGTGFHPELTGRENIFLNGAILGMTKGEIRNKFDEIVAFSGVEEFIDTPVKRYSSGMYVRLAFAVAAHLEPEILIVDEVLAVGDAEFQKKCLGKMQDVAEKEGRTVLFVSHNMAAVNRLCQTAVLMEGGNVAAQGGTASVIAKYLRFDTGEKTEFIPAPAKPIGNETITLHSLIVKGADGSPGPTFAGSAAIKVEITYRVLKPTSGLRVGFHLHGADGTIIFNATDVDGKMTDETRSHHPGLYASTCEIPAELLNRGQYSITVGSDTPAGVSFYCENVVSFAIVPDHARDAREENRQGLVCPRLKWNISREEEGKNRKAERGEVEILQ
ncbi:MAG TPA: ABC transporter ATP-binding protein [Verrucomicrobiae bacterium]|jgi:lipopolysaccharide transport system ATP-binding protein